MIHKAELTFRGSWAIFLRCLGTGLISPTTAGAVDLDRTREMQVLGHRALDGNALADILRSARIRHTQPFEVQGLIDAPPTPDGNARVSICYWLGDVEHVDAKATCGIGLVIGKGDSVLPDPETMTLSNALLTGDKAFDVALSIKYGQVCGIDPKRENRSC